MRRELNEKERAREAFFTWQALGAVALFGLNNFWLKWAFPGYLTGKLSDAAAAFFLPLFLSALLAPLTPFSAAKRISYGSGITLAVFLCVKGNEMCSSLLNRLVEILTSWTGLVLMPNLADPSDLIVLPIVAISWHFGRQRAD